MLETERVMDIFQDAKALHADAMEELGRGKLRNAAEKAWGATLRATDALILARTGVAPEKTPATASALHRLALEDSRVEGLVGRYHTRADYLHGQCFYLGLCDPSEDVERRIRETAYYIRDAQQLAETQ